MASKADKRVRAGLIACLAATPIVAFIGNRMGDLIDISDNALAGIATAPFEVWGDIALWPAHLGLGAAAMICTLIAVCIPWGIWLFVLMNSTENKRAGEEQGSARWADAGELEPFRTEGNPDPVFNNLILSDNIALALSRTGFNQKLDRNFNALVIGGSGTGKTRYYVKPNVGNMATDLFITDPKGSLIKDVGRMLVDNGYEIRCFNTFKPEKSLIYNPLEYVRTDLEIQSFAELLISMTTGTQKSGGDPFWEKAEKMLYMALIAYLRDYTDPKYYNFGGLLRLLNMAEVKEDNENFKSALDYLFEEIETGMHVQSADKGKKKAAPEPKEGRVPACADAPEDMALPASQPSKLVRVPSKYERRSDGKRPYDNIKKGGQRGFDPNDDYALENYKKFKAAAGKTLKSILISCNARLAPFTAHEVRKITCGRDEMHLERFGDADSKNALFCVFEDVDQRTLGFLHGIMVYQCIKVLCQKAESMPGDRLPRPVNFILDEYRSLNLPATISAAISVIRSRNIGMSIILQGISQLTELYDEAAAKSIRACCDTTLFLGASENDEETRKFISDAVGQMTVYDENYSSSHGSSGSWSKSGSKHARALIDPSEVGKMPRDKCIVLLSGTDACMDDKYHLQEHPNYGLMSDAGEFDYVEYLEKTRERNAEQARRAEEEKRAKRDAERRERIAAAYEKFGKNREEPASGPDAQAGPVKGVRVQGKRADERIAGMKKGPGERAEAPEGEKTPPPAQMGGPSNPA